MFVKICGVRTDHDVDAAVEAGADAIGLVFADSPRRVETGTARRLAHRVPEHVLTVGVFRRQPVAEVRALALAGEVRAVQLHGGEGREAYDALRPYGWTMIRGTTATGSTARSPHCGELGEDLLLLDAPAPGRGIPWNWAANAFTPPAGRWILAGGLTPDNVRTAIRTTAPWGVDVSSGVEIRRGTKDPSLIRSFVAAVRAAPAPR
jgi:phosphoribosylanthranilate isomerase